MNKKANVSIFNVINSPFSVLYWALEAVKDIKILEI